MDLDDFSHEMEKFADFLNTQTKVRIHHNTKFLLVEDGSVDFEQLEKYHILYIEKEAHHLK